VVCRINSIPSPGGLQAYIYLGISSSAVKPWHNPAVKHTDKKENQIFLIYKEIQNGAVAKSYMTNGLLIFGEMAQHVESPLQQLCIIQKYFSLPL
jgi:hypothetical protein